MNIQLYRTHLFIKLTTKTVQNYVDQRLDQIFTKKTAYSPIPLRDGVARGLSLTVPSTHHSNISQR